MSAQIESDAVGVRSSQGGSGPGRPRRGPIDPRLLQRGAATRGFLVAMVVVGGLTALLTVAQAWLLALAISGVFATHTAEPALGVLAPLASVFAGKAVLAWGNQVLSQRAAASVKSQLRVDIMRARLSRPLASEGSTGGLVTLVTSGLDALDGFYSKYLPQLVLAVVVPAIVGVAILTTDLLSTVIVVLTLPLIPLFMALVGWTTEARTKRRWSLQTRLARHFADLVEGLPTLQVFGRARAQVEGLRRTEGAHRAETMATLRISFLSALVLELLATLSVAVVAVTVGFRVLYGFVDLRAALFVLILAPEVYLPVRQVGVHYHDSADGMAAAEAAFALIDGPAQLGEAASVASVAAPGADAVPARFEDAPRPLATPDHAPNGVRSGRFDRPDIVASDSSVGRLPQSGSHVASVPTDPSPEGRLPQSGSHVASVPTDPSPEGRLPQSGSHVASVPSAPLLVVERVGHTYPGASEPAVAGVSFEGASGQFVVLTGPSGGGKTTVLNSIIGFVSPSEGHILVEGRPLIAADLPGWRRRIAYVGQTPGMVSGTIRDNVLLGFPAASDADARLALDDAGGAELMLDHPVGDDGQGLSAGERRRVATARALLRIRLGGAELLLLDEPTAGLDADAEATLLRGLRGLGVAAVIVSHRPAVIAEADQVVEIGGVR